MSGRKPGKVAAPAFVRVGSDRTSQEQALADAAAAPTEPDATAAGAPGAAGGAAVAAQPTTEAAPVYGWVVYRGTMRTCWRR